MSTGFIVGEIRDGRLKARVIQRDGYRAIYRISEAAFDDYIRRTAWSAVERTDRTAPTDRTERRDATQTTDRTEPTDRTDERAD